MNPARPHPDVALVLALFLCACGPAQAPPQATEAQLRDIGDRNDAAATQAAADQRAASAASAANVDRDDGSEARARQRAAGPRLAGDAAGSVGKSR